MNNPFRRSNEPDIANFQLDHDLAAAIDRITTRIQPTDQLGGQLVPGNPAQQPPFTYYYELPGFYLRDRDWAEAGVPPVADVPYRLTSFGKGGGYDVTLAQTPALNGELIFSRIYLFGQRRGTRLAHKVIDFSQQLPD